MYKFLFLSILSFLVISCNNDDESNPDNLEQSNYYALTVGNSWTYKALKRMGSTEAYEEIDYTLTTTITGTEVIDGETFYVFENSSQGTDTCSICDNCLGAGKVRDSLGYLVDEAGIVKFVNKTSEPYLIDSFNYGDLYGEYSEAVIFETPEGEFFEVQTNSVYVILQGGETSNGRDTFAYKDSEGLLGRTISTVNDPTPLYFMLLEDSVVLPD